LAYKFKLMLKRAIAVARFPAGAGLVNEVAELLGGAVPETKLHELYQEAAKRAGWIAPWERAQARARKIGAGKKSGAARTARQEVRRFFVDAAFQRLKPAFRAQPYSDHSITALVKEYKTVLTECAKREGRDAKDLLLTPPFKASRETLKDVLKKMGIKSKRSTRHTR
jgi:hypothetical protein